MRSLPQPTRRDGDEKGSQVVVRAKVAPPLNLKIMETTELRHYNYVNSKDVIQGDQGCTDIHIVVTPNSLKLFDEGKIDMQPIPLNEEWYEKCGAENFKIGWSSVSTARAWFIENVEIPEWIKYVHELQNWYYWRNKKTELTIE